MYIAKIPLFKGLSGRLLIALAIVALISVLGLGLAAYSIQRRALEDQVKAQLTSIADLKKEQIILWLEERQADAHLLAVNKLNQDHFTQILSPDIPAERKAEFADFLTDNLISLQNSRVGYSEIALIDKKGTVIVATNPTLVGQPTLHDTAFTGTLNSPDGMFIQDIHFDPAIGIIKMAFGHVIHAINLETGQEMPQIIGVALITVDMNQTIYPLIQAWPGMGDTGETLLIRAEGDTTLFLNNLRFDEDAALKLQIPATSPDAKPAHFSSRGAEGIIQTPDYRGVPVLAAYRHIPEINWGFVAKEDSNAAFAPIQNLAYSVGGTAIAVLFMAGVVSFILSRTLTRPLAELVQATQAVTAGQLKTKIDVDRTDEIGALADSFRAMIRSLEQRQQQVEQANAAIRHNANDLKITSNILHRLNATPDIAKAFPAIVEALRPMLGFETISLALLDESRKYLNITAMDNPRIVPINGLSLPVTDTAIGKDLLAGRPHLTPHLITEIDFSSERGLYEAGYRSRISLPLRIGKQSIGALILGWAETEGYDSAQIPLLSQIVDAIALAVERSRLFEETQRHSNELAALYDLSVAVNSSLEPSQVLQMAVDHSVQLLDVAGAGIFLIDEHNRLQLGALNVPEESIDNKEWLEIVNLIWQDFSTTDKPAQNIKLSKLPIHKSKLRSYQQQQIELFNVIRLTHSDETLGILGLLWPQSDITAAENQLARTIGQIISPAIAHAQSFSSTYEQLQQTYQRLTVVNKISRHLSSILDVDRLLADVVPLVQGRLGYTQVGIGLVDKDEIVFEVLTDGDSRLPKTAVKLDELSVANWVVRHNQAKLWPNVPDGDCYAQHIGINVRSMLVVPIRLAEQVMGIFLVASQDKAAFDNDDETLLQAIADQLALALQNAQLYSQMRQRAIDALQESEERLRSIYNAANDAIFLINPRLNQIIDANLRASNMLGYSQEELAGLSVEAIHPDEMELINQLWETTLQQKVGHSNQLTCLTKDGQKLPAEASFSLVQIRDQQYILAMVRDVTKRKQLEEQLRQSQKMEAIGQLAGGIAHDFNNILTVITGYSGLLLHQAKDENILKDIEQIQKAGERATTLTRQLLAFSRKQVLQPKVLDLNTIVTDMEKMLGRLIGENVELITDLQNPLQRIKADPGQIEQVILNLAVNGRDAMPRGGQLTIKTATVMLDDQFDCRRLGLKAGPYITLTVNDTGIGMDTKTQARIFEPFFTTKDPNKGTGLGLATVYGIVTQSKGTIEVISEPNKGTAFVVYLPQIEDFESTSTDLTLDGNTLTWQGSETILLAEDAAGVRAIAFDVLKRYGYHVLQAKDGNEALQISKAHDNHIHLLLTDVVMPYLNGPELAEHIKAAHPTAKVLYMSGYTDNPIVQHDVLTAGAAFIQKPFSPKALVQKVRQMLDGDQTRASIPLPEQSMVV